MSAIFAANCYQSFLTGPDGLGANGQYGLSMQVAGLASGIAAVWVNVKWPLVGQLRARQDYAGLLHLLRPRFWYQALTFILLALGAAVLGPTLLEWVGFKTQLLPRPWFPLLMIAVFLDLQTTFWTSLLGTENRIPSAWPITLTNLASVTAVFILSRLLVPDWWMFVLVPFAMNLLFNYWYWPVAGARNLRTRWHRFAFSRAA